MYYTTSEVDVAMAKRKDFAFAQYGKPHWSNDRTPPRWCCFQKPNQLGPGEAVDPMRRSK
jgi:hypothetical protein